MTQPVMQLARVATAIAALTIEGVRIYDLDQMKPALNSTDCPLLGPSSNDPSFLSDWEARRITMQGNQANAYTLNYTLYQAPVGADRGLFAQYPAMVENARKVVEALQALPRVDGCKSIALAGMPRFGPVFDASGQQFHGAAFALRVIEF
jgi:hypothetical protein